MVPPKTADEYAAIIKGALESLWLRRSENIRRTHIAMRYLTRIYSGTLQDIIPKIIGREKIE